MYGGFDGDDGCALGAHGCRTSCYGRGCGSDSSREMVQRYRKILVLVRGRGNGAHTQGHTDCGRNRGGGVVRSEREDPRNLRGGIEGQKNLD